MTAHGSILVLTQCFPPTHGGMENLMQGLADALRQSGAEVQVYADGHGAPAEADHDTQLDYPVRRFRGLKPWRRLRKARAAAAFVRAHEVRAAFCDSWKSAEHTADAARRAGVPLVCLAHGNDVFVPERGRRRRRVARVLGRVHRVVANSRDTAGRVRALGIAERRISVVHPGVAAPRLDAAAGLSVMPPGHPRLLTLGRIERRKGHDHVIRSLSALVAAHPELIYVIAGNGPDRPRLEALVAELGLRRHVHFAGVVSEPEKAALLRDSDLFVMPSRIDSAARSLEGFGIAYLEAAWCGVPALAGRAGGASDAVVDGVTGILCDGARQEAVAAALAQCLGDPERLRRLGAAARERAQIEFSWTAVVGRYLRCISDTDEDGPR